MPNILITPNSGILEFNNGTAGSSTQVPLTGSSRISFVNDGELNITSNSSVTPNRFSVDGSQGRLFTITDNLTGSVFGVNDQFGLPLIDVTTAADDIITMGRFPSNALVIKNDKVGIGTNDPTEKLTINGGVSANALTIGSAGTVTLNATSYVYGTGSASAHRTALGAGAAGDLIFTSATKPDAQAAVGLVTLTPAAYAALVSSGTTDPDTIYIVQEE
jgi:hypothetical protein